MIANIPCPQCEESIPVHLEQLVQDSCISCPGCFAEIPLQANTSLAVELG